MKDELRGAFNLHHSKFTDSSAEERKGENRRRTPVIFGFDSKAVISYVGLVIFLL
jgi:hypothetical protein